MPSSAKTKPKKASELAADIKRHYVPAIQKHYSHLYRTHSILFAQPLYDLPLHALPRPYGRVPNIYVDAGDPVTMALGWTQQRLEQAGPDSSQADRPVLFVCAANDKRPGGDWETGVAGYEERLCRRSNLSATLATSVYPIPIEGAVLCEDVVVFRGPHERPLDRAPPAAPARWRAVPVLAVPPVRWPKLTPGGGAHYSFAEERDMVKRKMRAALAVCAHAGYADVVVGGDFGLGNGYRNPPREMAVLWREVLLWDDALRGRLRSVAFVFEDPALSTARLIAEHQQKGRRGAKAAATSGTASGSGSTAGSTSTIDDESDYAIFKAVFGSDEVARALRQPDPRYELGTLMSPA